MRKNLVILFHHGGRCSPCRMRLRSFAEHYKDVSERESEILAISSDDLEANRRLAIELDLPYPLLSDPEGTAIDKYTHWCDDRGAPLPSLFITDRFGALYTQHVASEVTELPDYEEVLDWLKAIQVQCPECPQI